MELQPVHRWSADAVQTARITESSHWTDFVWVFPRTTAGQSSMLTKIDWRIDLGDGTTLTDPCHSRLLEGWRRTVWALFCEPGDGRHRKWEGGATLKAGVQYISRWMVRRGLTELADITPAVANDYLADLKADKGTGDEDDSGIAALALCRYISPFDFIWWANQALDAGGLRKLAERPLGYDSVMARAQKMTRYIGGSIPALEDAHFIEIVNAAWQFIEERAERLIAASNELAECRISAFGTSSVTALRQRLARHSRKVSAENGYSGIAPLKNEIRDMRIACFIVIQALTGMRSNEILGLELDDVDHRDLSTLPSFIEVERSDDDHYEVVAIRGWLFKTVASREEVRWVVGLRPVGSDYLPPPVRAAQVLARLDAGWRRFGNQRTLVISVLGASGGLPLFGKSIQPAKIYGLIVNQKEWVERYTGFKGNLTTHMWRKTFAQYMVRVAAGLRPAISSHFKHVSSAMLEIGYLKAKTGDKELSDLIVAERRRYAAQILHEVATGERPVVGPKGEEIRREAAIIRARLGNRAQADLRVDIEEICAQNDFKLWDSDWGFCVFAAEGAKCHGKDTVLGPWARRAPNFAERSPPRCVECPHFAVAPEHEPFWRARMAENQAKWDACKGKALPAVEAQFRERVRQAEIVLTWIAKEKHHAA